MQKIVIDIFDDFSALIRRFGSDAKCDDFNHTWVNFAGRRLEDELGDGWMDDMDPDDFDRYFETFQKTFGELTVENEVGMGSAFIISIPVAEI